MTISLIVFTFGFGLTAVLAAGGAQAKGPWDEPCDPAVDNFTFSEAVLPCSTCASASVEAELLDLFHQDQADRQVRDFQLVRRRDSQRRRTVFGMLADNQIGSSAALYYSAFIFQHGNCPNHYRLAADLALAAVGRGEGRAKWLYASTIDRYLVSQNLPQRFGTQYKSGPLGYELYPVDPATTDSDRAKYEVPALDRAKEMAKELR